ncbi:MAG: type IV pilus modification PilV family protein [Methylobacter sp.]
MKKRFVDLSSVSRQAGMTLIELVICIVVVGIALAEVMTSISFSVQHSSEPMVKKQALAIAEALLEEIELMPITWCDPDDINVRTATGYTGCATLTENNLAPEAGETRGGLTPFDNVNDYNGYCMATAGCSVPDIRDINGSTIPNLAGYTSLVTVSDGGLNGIAANIGAALHITVRVTGPMDTAVVLEGYRTRYVPQEP